MLNPHIPSRNEENAQKLKQNEFFASHARARGWGVEHIADGIIRFRRFVRNGVLKRYVLIEKMRQTPHSLQMHEITIEPGKGLVVLGPTEERKEDIALPGKVVGAIRKSLERKDVEQPEHGA